MFSIKKIRDIYFNTLISLPNFNEEWLKEKDMCKILFLYTYIRVHRFSIDGHYEFNIYDYLSTLYSPNSVKKNWSSLIVSVNAIFKKLKEYGLITNEVTLKDKNDTVNLDFNSVVFEFEDGAYTLIDYPVFKAICNTNADVEKDKLFYCCLFLNNRARNEIGYTSFEDIGKILGSKTTISKYLNWFKENEIFDYYSTNHKLDENGVPKRGNTIVAKWANRHLIEKVRSNDVPSTNSKADIDKLNEMFADDAYFNKIPDMLKNKYGLINNFLLLRLYNELPFGFTWKAIYKYLNSTRNIEYFNSDDEGEIETNKTKVINKVVNVAKVQEQDVMGYDDSAKKDELIGRAYKKANKNKSTDEVWGQEQPDFNSNEENIDWYDLL